MISNSSKMTDFGAFSSTIEYGKHHKNHHNKSLHRSRDTNESEDDLGFSQI
jgi:hypothetical protein